MARAICEGAGQLKLPIVLKGSNADVDEVELSFEAWWSNTAKLGNEIGDSFGRGLLRAAGVEGDAPGLKVRLAGDKPTSLVMVQALMGVSSSLE